jgi:hypothetical protein
MRANISRRDKCAIKINLRRAAVNQKHAISPHKISIITKVPEEL